jgi:hypothetical protein
MESNGMANSEGRPDNPVVTPLYEVVSEAAKTIYGKQENAALVLRKHPGNFSRDLRAERMTLRDLRELGPEFLAAFGQELIDEYGELTDPKARARRTLAQMEAACRELRQFVDSL